jgi:hypothetical protein
LKLNEAKSEVILVINGDKVDKFEVNEENGALNVYGLNGEEFGRVTKIEEIEILASIKSILSAGIAGAVLGSLARIFITNSLLPAS